MLLRLKKQIILKFVRFLQKNSIELPRYFTQIEKQYKKKKLLKVVNKISVCFFFLFLKLPYQYFTFYTMPILQFISPQPLNYIYKIY